MLFKINIGQVFWKLITLPEQQFKVFNSKTIKRSYSCTKNMFKIIDPHKYIINKFNSVNKNFSMDPHPAP